jgi:hypothetical protein
VFLRRKLSDVASKPLVLDKDRTSGLSAWGVLVVGILVYEMYAIRTKKIETLTRAFWRLSEKQLHASILNGVWLGLTFHLLIEKSLRKLILEKKG